MKPLKMTLNKANEARKIMLDARDILRKAESLFEDAIVDEDDLEGDDPYSNLISAMDCLEDALDGCRQGSPFIEIVKK